MFLWPLKCYPAHDDALKCALRLRAAISGRKYAGEAAVRGEQPRTKSRWLNRGRKKTCLIREICTFCIATPCSVHFAGAEAD